MGEEERGGEKRGRMEGDGWPETILDMSPAMFDNGSLMMKAGWTGDDAPSLFSDGNWEMEKGFPSGKLKSWESERDVFVGDEAQAKRGNLDLTYPIPNDGSEVNWEEMEKIWHHAFYLEVRCYPEENPLMFTNFHCMDDNTFEKMTNILFEEFNSQILYVVDGALTSLLASGKVTGTILESGDGITRSLSFYCGMPIFYSHMKIVNPTIIEKRLAGSKITDYLVTLLESRGYPMTTPAELEIVRDIKEKLCYVAPNYKEELRIYEESQHCDHDYELPDGNVMKIGSERFMCTEILFQPELVGMKFIPTVPEIIVQSIEKCNRELHRQLFDNIVLSGGSTMFEGIVERLKSEVSSFPSSLPYNVEINAPAERKFSSWIGGSILGSLSTFENDWIHRKAYDENGSNRLFLKHYCVLSVPDDGEDMRLMKLRISVDPDQEERRLYAIDLESDIGISISTSSFEMKISGIVFLINL